MSSEITVVVGTRNRSELLSRALGSIAEQEGVSFECVVVDDGSDAEEGDRTRRLVESMGERFRLVNTTVAGGKGTGPAAVKNRGIVEVRTPYLTFLDDDDWFVVRDHFRVAVEALATYNADYLVTNRQGVRDGRIVIDDWYLGTSQLRHGRLVDPTRRLYEVSHGQLAETMRHVNPHPGNLVLSHDLVKRCGGFLAPLNWTEDFNFCLRAADGAARLLYRDVVTTHARMPTGDSVSLSKDGLTHQLQELVTSAHLRTTARRAEIKRCARARHAWTLRVMAAESAGQGDSREAWRLSLEALMTFPTLGGVGHLARTLGQRIRGQ
jgi:glycosyltransferase involved in cell wall biosynthesis